MKCRREKRLQQPLDRQRPHRAITWIEELVKGFFGFIIGQLCLLALNKARQPRSILLLRKWTLHGLGVAYFSWFVLMFLVWVRGTLQSIPSMGSFVGIVNYLLTCFADLLAVGL